MVRSKNPGRKPEKKVRQHQSTLRLFSQVEIPSELLRDLLRASEYGDIPSVQEIVATHPMLDTNGPDMFGRTALQIAVANEHAEIVEILLDHSSPANIYLALLLAINHNYENITELILQHPTYRQYHDKWQELALKLPDTSPFSDDISPIILACQKNLFGIVHLLLQDGMRVPVPHHFDCACEECQEHRLQDQLKHAKRRLNEYRALTSEAYISLTSPDPFQTAFELCKEMELRATWEKHFKREYKALIAQMRRYVVKLLDCIRTHDELTTILDWSGGISSSSAPAANTSDTVLQKKRQKKSNGASVQEQIMTTSQQPLSRLNVAIYYHQKEFVSHWACQQELMRKWMRGFSHYHGSSSPTKIFTNLMLTLLAYPILMVFHWVTPNSKLGRMVTKPMVKFVSYSMSYLTFLGILFIITITPTGFYAVPKRLSQIYLPADDYQPLYDIIANFKGITSGDEIRIGGGQSENLYEIVGDFCNESRGIVFPVGEPATNAPVVESVGQLSSAGVWQICKLNRDFTMRPHADNWVCWIVTIWLLGLLCRIIRQLFRGSSKLSSITRSPFDMVDIAQLAFFAGALASRFYAYYRVTEAVVFFLALRPSPSRYALLPNYLYWLPSDRVFFHPGDPMTISELLFAIGSVFSFARLLYIFPALEVFGPCYLALMRVVKDIFAFFFVFVVVFAAFMIGTLNVYWYFNPALRMSLQLNESYNPEIPAERRFGNIELTFRTVFWSLFGLGESDYMSIDNFGNGSMVWVERIGYIMYGAYNIVVVLILLNMLIAMMAKSYEVIKLNSEMEWKFARTILFLEYIPENTPAIPTPFNLLPNPRYLWEVVSTLLDGFRPFRRCQGRENGKPVVVLVHHDDVVDESQRLQQQILNSSSEADGSQLASVSAPVQIRIEQTEDEVVTTDSDEDTFTVETVAVPGPPLLSKPGAESINKNSAKDEQTTSFTTKPNQNIAAPRVEHGTMTSGEFDDDESEYDEIETCCNFCFLAKCVNRAIPDSSPRLRTRNRHVSADGTPLSRPPSRRYGDNLHLSVPGGNNAVDNRRGTENPALLKFRAVVFNILRRYILGLSTQNSETTVDLEEIKQDISSFRFEVLNLLSSESASNATQAPATAHQAPSSVNPASASRQRRMSRVQLNGSPLSIKSLSAADYNNNSGAANSSGISAPPEFTRENSISANNLLAVSSPSHQFLTPTSEFYNSEQNSPVQESAAKSPRLPRSFVPYRRRSLLPSSIVGSLLPVVTSGTASLQQSEEEADADSDDNNNNNNTNTTPPHSLTRQRSQPQRMSPSGRVMLSSRSHQNSETGPHHQLLLEEVDEQAEKSE